VVRGSAIETEISGNRTFAIVNRSEHRRGRLSTCAALCIVAPLLVGIAGCRSGATAESGGRPPAPGTATQKLKIVDSASLRQGIAAEVRLRPIRPIEEDGVIAWEPLPGATVVVEDADRTTLGRVTSDANGRFYLELGAGTHYLRPQKFRGKDFPHPLPADPIYVPEGGIATVVLNYDTGIR
jgi:hypothetical protein